MRGDTEEAKRDAGATNAMLIAAETISMMITFAQEADFKRRVTKYAQPNKYSS